MIEAHSQLLMHIQSNSRALATAAGARPLRSLRKFCVVVPGLRETHSQKTSVIDTTGQRGCPTRTIQALCGVAVFIAVVAFWNFGTLSPCGVLREAAQQRDSLAAVLPDSIVDLGLEGQYGPLSPDRCLAVMMKSLGPILSTTQASRPQMMQQVPRPAPVPPLKIRQTERQH